MTGFTAENFMSGQAVISEAILGKPSWPNRPKPVPLWQRNQLSFFVTTGAEPRAMELMNAGSISSREVRERNDQGAINRMRQQTDWAVNPARGERPESATVLAVETDQSFSGETNPFELEPERPTDVAVINPDPVVSFKEHQESLFNSLSLLALKKRSIQASEYMILSGSHALTRLAGKNSIPNPHIVNTRNRPAAVGGFFDDDPSDQDAGEEEIVGFTVPFSFQTSSGYHPETWFPVAARIGLYQPVPPKPFGERCDYLM